MPSAVSSPNCAASVHLREIIYNLSTDHEIYAFIQKEHGLVPKKNIVIKEISIPVHKSVNPLLAIVQRCLLISLLRSY